MRYCVTSDYIQKIVVHSMDEQKFYAEHFHMPAEKFAFVKLGVEDRTEEVPIKESKGYYLAPGRSNRDYSFLLSAWNNQFPLKIVCDSIDVHTNEKNIEILKDCHGEDYLKLLAECYAVIIPLEDVHASSGQLVILQAMMYGKPIIVTENDSVKEYVVDGEDGYIIKKEKDKLLETIDLVKTNYTRISSNELNHFKEKYSLYAMGTSIGNLMTS